VTDKAILLAGPTGSGKSALALEIAELIDGAIVNADSMQVYRELKLLSARPSAEDEARVPHHLYGVMTAGDQCSVGRWLRMVEPALIEVRGAGRTPVFVGGTGLYLRALTEGLAPVPEIPPEIKTQAAELVAFLKPDEFHRRLSERDPEMAARLNPSDSQRVRRAWEVVEATGVSLAQWQAVEHSEPLIPEQNTMRLILDPPREAVYARCDARFDAMIEAGALAEVEALGVLGLDPELPIMKALGMPELSAYLAGELPLEQAVEHAKTATRRYAKRQSTWFRNQMPGWQRINAQYLESFKEKILSFIRNS
jgi:tRNA dimethylallyltransferase